MMASEAERFVRKRYPEAAEWPYWHKDGYHVDICNDADYDEDDNPRELGTGANAEAA
jgi:hypothetical protein